MAGDKSIIDHEDFRAALDIFAMQETDDIDYQFKIKRVAQQHKKKSNHKAPALGSLPESVSFVQSGSDIDVLSDEIASPEDINEKNFTMSIDLEDVFDDDDECKMPDLYNRRIVLCDDDVERARFRTFSSIRLMMSSPEDNDVDSENDDDNYVMHPVESRLRQVRLSVIGKAGFQNLLDQVNQENGK